MTVINNYDTWIKSMRRVNVQQNGQMPPTVFNGWYNEANQRLFRMMAAQYQTDQDSADLLMPFTKIVLLPVDPRPGQNWGLVTVPTDYEYFRGAAILTQKQEDECFSNSNLPIIDGDGKSKKYIDPDYAQMAANYVGANMEEGQIQLIDALRWQSCLTHHTKGATLAQPKATQYNQGFKIAPKGVVSVLLYYFSTPPDSVFAYTISDEDILIYDANASQQLLWSNQMQPQFLDIIEKLYYGYVDKKEQ